ncbi:MAG: AMMECR1 domain-containing protein [Deltaproteobacteria bacterium]|nr:MAG: AMMECR1 domain-containing protein [Deltaproteobacteria bacterium]
MTRFRFHLTNEEKDFLKNLVMASIRHRLGHGPAPDMQPLSSKLTETYGAFVTLTRNNQLRGCIGHIVGQEPLVITVASMACAAAFEDPRFPPVTLEEVEELLVEISILSPLTQVEDVSAITPGIHGLYLRQGSRSGLLLPQVAIQWGWDRETFLGQTCRKAGLPPDAWRDESMEIYWFQAEVF